MTCHVARNTSYWFLLLLFISVNVEQRISFINVCRLWGIQLQKKKTNNWFSPDYFRWTVQIMKFLILESSPLSIFIALGLNIRLMILFSNTLSLLSFLKLRDNSSQPYSTTGNIFVLYNLIFIFLESSLDWIITWNSYFNSTFHSIWFVTKEAKYLKDFTFLKKLLPIPICSLAIITQWHPIFMYLVFPLFAAKPISF